MPESFIRAEVAKRTKNLMVEEDLLLDKYNTAASDLDNLQTQ